MINRIDPPSLAHFKPTRNIENKNIANKKEQEDDRDLTVLKPTNTFEVKQLKNKMKLVMNKLIASKKEKELLAKENKNMHEQIISLQTDLRQMVPGFSNTSSNFPIQTELIGQIAEFYKQECLDKFFDLLYTEINLKGVIYFYSTPFKSLNKLVWAYLNPALEAIQRVGCFDSLQGPIMNVLRKSFQGNYKEIVRKILDKRKLQSIVEEIQSNLLLRQRSKEVNEQIRQFLEKLGQLIIYSIISDPPLNFDLESMGSKVLYNPLKHEAFDGFIKPKEECYIVLPELKKGKDGDLVLKSLVLQTSYVIQN